MGVICLGRCWYVGIVSIFVLWGGVVICVCFGLNIIFIGYCIIFLVILGCLIVINCKKEVYILIICNSSIFFKYIYVSIEVNYCIYVINLIRI